VDTSIKYYNLCRGYVGFDIWILFIPLHFCSSTLEEYSLKKKTLEEYQNIPQNGGYLSFASIGSYLALTTKQQLTFTISTSVNCRCILVCSKMATSPPTLLQNTNHLLKTLENDRCV
jgi:hypothetical protein